MWACCRYTQERFQRTHGNVLNAHTGEEEEEEGEEGGGGSSSVLLTKMAHVEASLSPERFTKRNLWILPISSLRISREQHVPDSSNHSLFLIKLFNSSSPEGKSRAVCYLQTHTQPQHTATQHHTNTYNTETERQRKKTEKERERNMKEKRQHNTTQDCRQLATLRESWFLLSLVRACFEFLTTSTFRALHGNRTVSTPFETIVKRKEDTETEKTRRPHVHPNPGLP